MMLRYMPRRRWLCVDAAENEFFPVDRVAHVIIHRDGATMDGKGTKAYATVMDERGVFYHVYESLESIIQKLGLRLED